jgi:hypothetical protein
MYYCSLSPLNQYNYQKVSKKLKPPPTRSDVDFYLIAILSASPLLWRGFRGGFLF